MNKYEPDCDTCKHKQLQASEHPCCSCHNAEYDKVWHNYEKEV